MRVGRRFALVLAVLSLAACAESPPLATPTVAFAPSATVPPLPSTSAPIGSRRTAGACSADVPKGVACNAIVNVATQITPTCAAGTIPTGNGGTITDGIYVATAQTFYNRSACPTTSVSQTLLVSGDCFQAVAQTQGAGDSTTVTLSFTIVAQGNRLTPTLTCSDINFPVTQDAPTTTFTATGSTLTLFTLNSAVGNPNPDRVEVFTRQ
jgi:hypothetical protein